MLAIPTVINGKPFAARSIETFQLYPDLNQPLQRLKAAGFLLVVITNQPDVANGLNSQAVIEAMHERMCRALPIDHVEVCYHADRDNCACRKPKPGMLHAAAAHLDLDLTASFMLGDQWRDIAAGHAAGCRTLLLERGYGESLPVEPNFKVYSVAKAVDEILSIHYRTPVANDANAQQG